MAKQSSASHPWVFDHTVGSLLEHRARVDPDGDALVFPAFNARWSWDDLNRDVNQIAGALIALGAETGEHVGIWSMNVPEWVITHLAVGRIGAVLVNVNPAYRLNELKDALLLADVATLIVGAPFKGSNFVEMVESLCPEAAAATARDWFAGRFPRLQRLITLGDRPGPGWWSWAELMRRQDCGAREVASRSAAVSAGDVHNIQFTSGTTGLPKGAMLTHRNVLMNAFYTGQRLGFSSADRLCLPVPLYHCFGCVLGTMVCLVFGAAIISPSPAFDAGATLAAIASERCTAVYGVPAMFVAELEHPDLSRLDLKSLRTGIMAGSPCPLPLMERVTARMGAREICIGYGQTEASPLITMTSVDDPTEVRVGTVGRPLEGLEVKLVDPATGAEVAGGSEQTGELCARGHCVMTGYYNNPQATARAVDADGWLHTGDLARRRDDGNYRIVGRSKELIIRGGENIYPPEVEEFLHRHPLVAEVAVAGLPDVKYGEVVGAWVVPKSGETLTAEELRAYCEGQIAHFKVPRYLFVVESLPRTVTGKIRKHVLQEVAIGDLGLTEAARIETA
jgi:fatty-acyl-CoA synthase